MNKELVEGGIRADVSNVKSNITSKAINGRDFCDDNQALPVDKLPDLTLKTQTSFYKEKLDTQRVEIKWCHYRKRKKCNFR